MKNVTDKQNESKVLPSSQKHPVQKQDVFVSAKAKDAALKQGTLPLLAVTQSARSMLAFYSLNGKSIMVPTLAEKSLEALFSKLGNLATPLIRQRATALFFQVWQGETLTATIYQQLLSLVKSWKSLAKFDPFQKSKSQLNTEDTKDKNETEQVSEALQPIELDLTQAWRSLEQESQHANKDWKWKNYVLTVESSQMGGFQGNLRFAHSSRATSSLRIGVDFFTADWFVSFFWEDKKQAVLRYRAYPEHLWSQEDLAKLKNYLPRDSFAKFEAMNSQDWYDGFDFFPNSHIIHNVDVLQ